MKLVAISCVKNEADIVEAFVRHAAAHCDAHVVLDNGSTDDTADVLHALQEEGMDLHLIDDPIPGAYQARRMTRLMRMAVEELKADWVIPLDADEFLRPIEPGALRSALASISTPVHVGWQTYVPTAEDSDDPNPVVRIQHRLVEEGYLWKKVLVPADRARAAHLEPGSHDLVEHAATPRPVLEDTVLGHFPIRSAEQYAAKVVVSNLQWEAQGNRGGLGFHFEEPYARLVRGWKGFADIYADDALHYSLPAHVVGFVPELVLDPFPYLGGSLRHEVSKVSAEPWGKILEYALDLARRHAYLAASVEETDGILVQTRAELDTAGDDLAEALEESKRLRERADALEASTSWSVTRPLRAVGRAWRGLRRR